MCLDLAMTLGGIRWTPSGQPMGNFERSNYGLGNVMGLFSSTKSHLGAEED